MERLVGLPDRLVARHASLGDVDGIAEVIAAAELEANGVVDIDREDVETDLSPPLLESEGHSLVVVEGERVVAASILHASRGVVYADVDPERRGRGIGSMVLAWSEGTARKAGARVVAQTKSDGDASAKDLLLASGYAPRWVSWLLEYRMVGSPPESSVPEGIRLRPFQTGTDERAVHRVIDDAFSEWEDRLPEPFERWRRFTVQRETFDPRLSPVAEDGDEVVGAAISLVYEGDEEGCVQQLAVKRSHRSRGIGRALLLEAFRGFHRMRRRVVVLSTESRTGALGMYERVGMRVRRSYTSYSKDL